MTKTQSFSLKCVYKIIFIPLLYSSTVTASDDDRFNQPLLPLVHNFPSQEAARTSPPTNNQEIANTSIEPRTPAHLKIRNKKQFNHLKDQTPINEDFRPFIIDIYMNGGFGLNPKLNKTKREGRHLAEFYGTTNVDVQNQIIEAMRNNKLGYRSKRNYNPSQKKKGKTQQNKIQCTRELDLIRGYAMDGNIKAGIFLLDCYIDGKYGADPLNSKLYIKTVDSLIEMARIEMVSDSLILQGLIIKIYAENLFSMPDRKRLCDELYTLKMQFDPLFWDAGMGDIDPTFNPFDCLADNTNMDDVESI